MNIENETATVAPEKTMQDVANDIEAKLYPPQESEPTEGDDDVVLEGDESLPEEDDTDSDDEEGSEDEDIEQEAEDADMTLADFLGVDEDKLIQDEEGRWMYNATIDGEQKAVPLSELTKSYQLQGHVNNKSIELENQRKEFNEQRTKVATELKERMDGAEQMTDVLQKELTAEFNGIDWDRLRAEKPEQWAVMRQDFSEKAQRIQEVKALIGEEKIRIQQEQQQAQQAALQEHLQVEYEKMLTNNPEWVDQEVLTKEMGVLKDFVKTTYGFEDEDTKLVTDHRLISLIQDAHKFRSGEKARKGAESKKEKVVPKFQKSKSTATKSSQLAQARKIKAKRAQAKKTGSVEDIANVLIDRM